MGDLWAFKLPGKTYWTLLTGETLQPSNAFMLRKWT
jgi:hypothetical protein